MGRYKPIFGSIAAGLTAFTPGRELHYDSIEKLIAKQKDSNTSAIFMPSKIGEAYDMGIEKKKALMAFAGEVCERYDLPFLAGVTGKTMKQTLELADYATEIPCAGVVVQPSAIPDARSASQVFYFVQSVGKPVYGYVNDSFVTTEGELLTPEVAYLNKDKLAGIKVTVRDNARLAEYVSALRGTEVDVYCGNHTEFFNFKLPGLSGIVTGGANLYPHEYVVAFKEYREGRDNLEIGREPLEFLRIAKEVGISTVGALKAGLRLNGIFKYNNLANGTQDPKTGMFVEALDRATQ
jgi:dihydrodipicolinate synthase/N-acetylneuraminate lyase